MTSWNTGAERILGWAEADILGLDGAVFYTLAEREAGEPAAEMRDAAANGHASSERWMLRRDGTRFRAAQTMAPLPGREGEERGFLKLLRDCTERHRTEAALARLRQLSGARKTEATRRAEERDGSVKNLGRYAASWIAWWPKRPSSSAALT